MSKKEEIDKAKAEKKKADEEAKQETADFEQEIAKKKDALLKTRRNSELNIKRTREESVTFKKESD